jgi:Flp pilus assembly secretin CpaC
MLVSLTLASPIFASLPARAANVVVVRVDEARIARLPERVATLVLGSPLVADVSMQAGGIMVITGKGYGETNLVALDKSGAILAEQIIQVRGNGDLVTVYRGVERESYSCAPKCERRITLGDGGDYFNATLGQAVARSQAAQSIAGSH